MGSFLERNKFPGDPEALTRFRMLLLFRTGDGGISVTVCQDKAGTDESVQVAADWIRQNITTQSNPPVISEGSTIVQFNS